MYPSFKKHTSIATGAMVDVFPWERSHGVDCVTEWPHVIRSRRHEMLAFLERKFKHRDLTLFRWPGSVYSLRNRGNHVVNSGNLSPPSNANSHGHLRRIPLVGSNFNLHWLSKRLLSLPKFNYLIENVPKDSRTLSGPDPGTIILRTHGPLRLISNLIGLEFIRRIYGLRSWVKHMPATIISTKRIPTVGALIKGLRSIIESRPRDPDINSMIPLSSSAVNHRTPSGLLTSSIGIRTIPYSMTH